MSLPKVVQMNINASEKSVKFDTILVWVSIASIFVSGLYVETDYGILFFSYTLMILTYVPAVARTGTLGLRKGYGLFFASLAAVSYLGFFISSFNYDIDIARLASIAVKIAFLAFFTVYFTAVYNLCKRSSWNLFHRYLEVALVFAVLGILQELMFFILGFDLIGILSGGSKDYGSFLGVAGLSVEPAFYACALLPAGAYYVSEFTRNFRFNLSGAIVVCAIIFSTSALGYIGLLISAVVTILHSMRVRYIWMLVLTLPVIGFGVYKANQLDFIRMRVNDTLSLLAGAEPTMATGMNISSYSLAVNVSMSLRSIQDNYGFGTGFGTYSTVFDHYINDYEMPTYRDDFPGRGSATSLFARLTAEIGVAAWLFIFTFGCWGWREIRQNYAPTMAIAYAATLCIILLRMGEYYVNGVVLAFLMIYWIHLEGRRERAGAKSAKGFISTVG